MEETRKDSYLLIAAILALCGETLLLLYQLRLVNLPWLEGRFRDDQPRIGAVSHRDRRLQSRPRSSLTWYPLRQGDSVHLNDTVMTGPGATARIRLEGDRAEVGEIELEGDTLVHFSDDRRWAVASGVVNLEVNQGVVRVRSRENELKVRVRSRQLAIAPGSEVTLTRKILESDSQVQVETGKVEVRDLEGDTPPVTLMEGNAVELPQSPSSPPVPVASTFELTSAVPAPGSRLLAEAGETEVRFSWDGGEGDVLEWDRSREFPSPGRVEADGEAEVDLAPGEYFWRVRRGLAVSPPMPFTVVPTVKYRLTFPEDDSVLNRRRGLVFLWDPVGDATQYQVQISRDEDFEKPQITRSVSAPRLEVPWLRPGRYYWRVRASSTRWGEWPYSDVSSFTLKAPLEAPKIKGAKVKEKKEEQDAESPEGRLDELREWIGTIARALSEWLIPAAHAGEDLYVFEFSWERTSGAAGYRVQIALDARFKQVVHTRDTDDTWLSVELPRATRYYWRVAAFDSDRMLGLFSQAHIVTVPVRKVVRLPAAARAPAAPPEPDRGLAILVPTWVRAGIAASFRYQSVSSDQEKVTVSGLPLGRLEGTLHWGRQPEDLELGFWYQGLRYVPKDSLPIDIQPELEKPELGGVLLYKGLWRLGDVPFTLGLGFSRMNDLARVLPEAVGVESAGYFPLYVGFSLNGDKGGDSFWWNDVLLEVAPAGSLMGAGLWFRSRWGLWDLMKPLTAELQFLVNPAYRYRNASKRGQFTVNVSASLVLGVSGLPGGG